MELIPLLCLLFPWFGVTSTKEMKPVKVPEGDDALLPCTLNSGDSIDKFDWRKDNGDDDKLEVFQYKYGSSFKDDPTGQNEQFKRRVDFFKDELKSGNASIIIRNTRLKDKGNYTCGEFELDPPVSIRLIVGAARIPIIKITRDEITWKELKCTAEGNPKPEIKWINSAGEELPTNEDGPSHVELKVNVTKSDTYTCVATQWGIYHQINDSQEVIIQDAVKSVAVSEGGDAVLPCSLNSNQNIKNMKFYWSKAKQEVFSYDRGKIEEDQQFTGRLAYFQQELGSGNASIKIYNTQKSDSGRYTCNFPDVQKLHVDLDVVDNTPDPNAHTGWILAGVFGGLFMVSLLISAIIIRSRSSQRTKGSHHAAVPLAPQPS